MNITDKQYWGEVGTSNPGFFYLGQQEMTVTWALG